MNRTMQPRPTGRFIAVLSLLLVMVLALSGCEYEGLDGSPVIQEEEAGLDEAAAAVIEETEAEPAAEEANPSIVGIQGVAEGTLLRGFALTDWDFENIDGEVTGEIEDFYFDIETGRIPFVIVEYGGVLDIGDTEIAMPLSAFALDADGGLILTFEEEALNNFPDQGEDWPDLADPAWDDEVIQFWNSVGLDAGPNIQEVSGPIVEVSDLTGFSIVDLGIGMGTVQDVLVDLGLGRVKYVLAGFGTGANVNDPYILPIEIFDIARTDFGLGNEIILDANVSQEMLLTAPRYSRQLFEDTGVAAPGVDADVEPYWRDFGY